MTMFKRIENLTRQDNRQRAIEELTSTLHRNPQLASQVEIPREAADDTATDGADATNRRNQRVVRRIVMMLVLAVLAVLTATSADARGPSGFTGIYRSIVADDNFRANYQAYKRRFPAPRFNWGNDGCSGPARFTGYNDNFYWPCVQHDFGYRNNRIASQHNEDTRKFVDDQFLQHMKQICDRYDRSLHPGKVVARQTCFKAAEAFHLAVRHGAKSSWH